MKLKVLNQKIYPYEDTSDIASDSVEFVKVEFVFSKEWEGLSKVAQFTQDGKTYDKIMKNNIVDVPVEIKEGMCEISVFGVNGAVRGTTLPYKVNVFKSGYVDNAEHPIEPTPTLYAQLVARVEDIEQKAEEGEFDGKSAYEIAVNNGFVGTEEEWLKSLHGKGYVITEEDKQEIKQDLVPVIMEDIQPTLENNLKQSKDYTDNSIARDFKDISYDENTATFIFTRHDNTTVTVDLPIEQTVKDGRYDETTQELVLVLVSGQEIRIPASGLIDDYTGVDSATIQLTISADNKITANIISGAISKTLLTTELQEEINGKLNSNLVGEKILKFTYEDGTTENVKLVVYK